MTCGYEICCLVDNRAGAPVVLGKARIHVSGFHVAIGKNNVGETVVDEVCFLLGGSRNDPGNENWVAVVRVNTVNGLVESGSNYL